MTIRKGMFQKRFLTFLNIYDLLGSAEGRPAVFTYVFMCVGLYVLVEGVMGAKAVYRVREGCFRRLYLSPSSFPPVSANKKT